MAALYRLVMRSGPTAGKAFPLEKTDLTLGRELNNDIVINDPEISRKHVHLFVQGSVFVIEDLGSTNGTFVNGVRLTVPASLRPGDAITFGERITAVFEAAQPDPDATVVAGAPPAQVPPQVVYTPPVSIPMSSPSSPSAQFQPPAQQFTPPAPAPQFPPAGQDYYAGQVPSQQAVSAPPKKISTRIILIILLVLFLLVTCLCVGFLYWVDANARWCDFFPFLFSACQ